jgi:hypothetical protein
LPSLSRQLICKKPELLIWSFQEFKNVINPEALDALLQDLSYLLQGSGFGRVLVKAGLSSSTSDPNTAGRFGRVLVKAGLLCFLHILPGPA